MKRHEADDKSTETTASSEAPPAYGEALISEAVEGAGVEIGGADVVSGDADSVIDEEKQAGEPEQTVLGTLTPARRTRRAEVEQQGREEAAAIADV